jgi:hypothetical protein
MLTHMNHGMKTPSGHKFYKAFRSAGVFTAFATVGMFRFNPHYSSPPSCLFANAGMFLFNPH